MNDKILHFRDIENTFTYYQNLYISDYGPKAGPTSGKTAIRVRGMGFSQFKYQNGSSSARIWVRFIDAYTNQTISEETLTYNQNDREFWWKTPAANLDTKAVMEYSFNR